MKWRVTTLLFVLVAAAAPAQAQESVARRWNELLLDAIRIDTPRPTVHARNLFHTSAAMYDAWAAYDPMAEPYFLGNEVHGFDCSFSGLAAPADVEAARAEAVSHAVYRVLYHRFAASPGAATSLATFDALMDELGYDRTDTSTDYMSGSPAALGNYVADCVIDYGLQDGSSEGTNYGHTEADYFVYNTLPMDPNYSGTQADDMFDLNRWQPLTPAPNATQTFLTPHWGRVAPFAIPQTRHSMYRRDGIDFSVYLDPGTPPHMDVSRKGLDDDYKWMFALNVVWSSHLDPDSGILWDISPASKGNTPSLPTTMAQIREHYDFLEGGQKGEGYTVNPKTGEPYTPQLVPLGDFARVLSEFWADGPKSETPPGHWYTILNYVSDHALFEKRFKGEGEILDDLEWDVKSYFALGGAIHDAAVATWGVKSYYDYTRPISAIRGMAERGQSSDPSLPSYDPAGLPLIDGHIELVEAGDPLAGANDENVGKVKVFAWRGHGFINDPATDVAGVDWILAENWWPYQKADFVTPPFAGYTSGHSAFSRAAAEVLTYITGDPFFPGGMGEFHAAKDEYLLFENGPSVDVTLQWATYRDASDEASLSRLWGGIHPPIDDIPGRQIGLECGVEAAARAEAYFTGAVLPTEQAPQDLPTLAFSAYPTPLRSGEQLNVELSLPATATDAVVRVYNLLGQVVDSRPVSGGMLRETISLETNHLAPGLYMVQLSGGTQTVTKKVVVLR